MSKLELKFVLPSNLFLCADGLPRLKSHNMRTRNKDVETKLRVKYEDRLQDGDLYVFCVSNLDYEDRRDDPEDDFLPYLERSQIRKVRMHCISLIAETQFHAAEKYIEDRIESFLSSMGIWVDAGSQNSNEAQWTLVLNAFSSAEFALRTVSPLTIDFSSLLN